MGFLQLGSSSRIKNNMTPKLSFLLLLGTRGIDQQALGCLLREPYFSSSSCVFPDRLVFIYIFELF